MMTLWIISLNSTAMPIFDCIPIMLFCRIAKIIAIIRIMNGLLAAIIAIKTPVNPTPPPRPAMNLW